MNERHARCIRIVAMIANVLSGARIAATIPYTPEPPGPEHKPEEPTPPGRPEPDEMPFTEPKHFPIHPDIPVQPIHERDPFRALTR